MSYELEEQSHSENHNTLPRQNVEWVEAIVKWTRYDYVAVYDYPTTHNSETVMEIYKGDMLQVSRRYRREDWCLCQIGHVLGWVFLQDVRFIVQGAQSPRPQRQQRVESPEIYQETDTERVMYRRHDASELKTEPAVRPPQILKPDVPETETMPAMAGVAKTKKPMIERLISFFKR